MLVAGEAPVVDEEGIEDDEHEAEQGHDTEGPAPAELDREDPPRNTPSTEPNDPPAMNAPVSDARRAGEKTMRTTARPTLPYAASPRPMKKRASIICS